MAPYKLSYYYYYYAAPFQELHPRFRLSARRSLPQWKSPEHALDNCSTRAASIWWAFASLVARRVFLCQVRLGYAVMLITANKFSSSSSSSSSSTVLLFNCRVSNSVACLIFYSVKLNRQLVIIVFGTQSFQKHSHFASHLVLTYFTLQFSRVAVTSFVTRPCCT